MKICGVPRVAHRVGRLNASDHRRRGQLCTVCNPHRSTYRSGKVVQTNRATSKVKAVATNVGITPAAVVAALDGAIYPDGDLNMSAAWMGGGAATTIKSTADFLKGAGRISAAADSYTKFVNPEFAKTAAGK